MKSIIGLFVIFFVSSSIAEDSLCFFDGDGFTICINSGNITKVSGNSHQKSYTLRINSNVTIGPGAFNETDLRSLKLSFGEADTLDLDDLVLTLEPDAFLHLDDLAELEISNVYINFTGKPLAHLGKLTTFTWRTSRLHEVPSALFEGVPQLRELEIVNSRIKVLRTNDFASLGNLTSLSVRINEIDQLEPGCFNGLDALSSLDLSNSQLKELPDVFSDLKNLKKLRLRDCRISEIAPNALGGMLHLETLDLVGNFLHNIPVGTFDQLPGLRHLKLDRNHWLNVKKGLFNKIPSLTSLSLQDLGRGSIEPGSFSGMNMTSIDLHACEVLQPGVFNGLIVDELKLSGWHYYEVPRVFQGLTARILDLSSNSIKKIDRDDFAGLTTEVLNLHWNSIREIAPGAFKNTTVSKIILTKNPIENVNKTLIGVPESVEITEDFLAKKWYEDDEA